MARVAVDENNQPRWVYRPDDPQLLGRELNVTSKAVTIDEGTCISPRWIDKTTTWQSLLTQHFHRPPSASGSTHPSPENFGLNVNATAKVKAFVLKCAKSEDSTFLDNAWFVPTEPNQLIVNFEEHALLVLKRRELRDVPNPSFDCHKANKVAERTICSSIAVSAWDRSVALALAWKLKTASGEKQKAVLLEQAAWLKERDACKDVECIAEAHRQRLWQLR